LTDIVSHIQNGDLSRDIRTVLEHGETIERNVHHKSAPTHYLMRILPYRSRNNVIEGVVLTFFDVTKMSEAESRQRTLVNELNHRVRNMLSVVSAMAQQTMSRSDTAKDFMDAFTARIHAMAATYSLVSDQNWGDVPVKDIFAKALEPFKLKGESRA